MPAHIVIVHTDAAFLEAVCAALSATGKSVCGYSDAMQALDALEGATTIEVLVTRVNFGEGKLNGVALARMAQLRRGHTGFAFGPHLYFGVVHDGFPIDPAQLFGLPGCDDYMTIASHRGQN
jgi:hypothetical protein